MSDATKQPNPVDYHPPHIPDATGEFPGGALAADYGEILETLRCRSLERLEAMLPPMLEDLASHLSSLALKENKAGLGKRDFYDAMVQLQRKRKRIGGGTLRRVDELYHDLTPEVGQQRHRTGGARTIDELGLVDITEFEDSLAIERLLSLSEEKYGPAMEALVIRLAMLVDADPRGLRLPLHPRQLCDAVQRALSDADFPPEVISPMLQFFARGFYGRLHSYYGELNRFLRERGLRPSLEKEIESRGTLLGRRIPKSRQRHDRADPARSIGVLAYRSLLDILNYGRERGEFYLSGSGSAAAHAAARTPDGRKTFSGMADITAIAHVLAILQRDPAVRKALEESQSLREYLDRHQNQFEALRGTSGFSGGSLDHLDLADSLYAALRSRLNDRPELTSALEQLQIPLARLSMMDPGFFADRGHAARGVLDALSQIASSSTFPNRTLEKRINEAIREIAENYDGDEAVFDRALEKLEALNAQQQRALDRTVEHVVRMLEGQEKLRRAQRVAEESVADLLGTATAPRVIFDLVDNGWRDLLVLTYIRSGPESDAWQKCLATLGRLDSWLAAAAEGDGEAAADEAFGAERLVDGIEEEIAAALPTHVSHQPVMGELRGIFWGERPVEMVAVQERLRSLPPDTTLLRQRIDQLPRLRRWVRRAEQLEVGAWLARRDRSGQKHNMRLVWISESRDRYAFVDERGRKVAELTAVELARLLSQGVHPPVPADALSVVDQSLYHTLEQAQAKLSFARNLDALTSLVSPEAFTAQLQRALRRANSRNLVNALLYLDIDHFRLVNEIYDRVSGDQVLMDFSKLLAQLHGSQISSTRLEGDRFAVLLLDHTPEQATAVAEKIRADVESSSLEIASEKVSFTVSIGVVPLTRYEASVDEVLEAARDAARQAKDEGRNRVVCTERAQVSAEEYVAALSRGRRELEDVLESGRLVLRAQSVVRTPLGEAGEPDSLFQLSLGLREAQGAEDTLVSLLQSAERWGAESLLDRWVVNEAFHWISRLMDEQKVVPNLSIRLSHGSVTDDSFLDYLLEKISEFGVGTSLICFDINEVGTSDGLVKAADFVRTLRNIGCRFSLGDFGNDATSRNYLRDLPVDYVRIDSGMVRGLDSNQGDCLIIRSINDMAHLLGQKTVVDSVEGPFLAETLRELSVDYLQERGTENPVGLSELALDLSSVDR